MKLLKFKKSVQEFESFTKFEYVGISKSRKNFRVIKNLEVFKFATLREAFDFIRTLSF